MSEETSEGAIPAPEGPADIIETDYQIGQDNITPRLGPLGLDIHSPVFMISGLTIVVFVIVGLVFREATGAFLNGVDPAQVAGVEPGSFADLGLRAFITSNMSWFFLLAGNVFVLLCLFLVVSPYGSVRIGGRDATPDYSYVGWLAMLFAAGMGIGLMFYGVSEPISHYSTAYGGPTAGTDGTRTDWAPLGGAAGDHAEARRLGMAATIFHWALHPWAIYAIVALSLAIFSYNKGLPLTIRSIFYPIFGDRVWGWTGHVIDTLAVFATLFGLATSLGIGAEQAVAGLQFLFGLPVTDTSKVVLILSITAVAILSVLAGLDAGVKRLSEINMSLAGLLLVFVIAVGPTIDIVTGFFANLVAYARYLPALSMPFGREDANFSQGWTSFYWAWWISWSPFVGMFIARVSRGRTVREFIICVLIVPSLVSVLWMSAFGGTALTQIITENYTEAQHAALELKLFKVLAPLPLAGITSFIGIVLVLVFFVTSSDSGSLVIDTITAGGKVNAPVAQRVFWASFEGLVAIALLLGGGLAALQAMAVSTGLPFTIILLLACCALVKGLASEPR